jgi:DeoR family transcriptional regulator, ulaG and ulaABCDEF operon transcriptional repressor
MHQQERHGQIAALLQRQGTVGIQDIMALSGASRATVRRDLEEMDTAGLLRRVRGGAQALGARPTHLTEPPFDYNATLNRETKRAIARRAVELCGESDSIIIDGGTTTFAMTEFLVQTKLEVLTNSIPIADYLMRHGENRVTLPGGEVFREQQLILSPFDQDLTHRFFAAKLFMGAQALTQHGLLQSDPLLIRAEQKLIDQAEKLVVLVDSSKFKGRGSLILCPLSRIDIVVTDDGISDTAIALLRDADVELITVPRWRNRSAA